MEYMPLNLGFSLMSLLFPVMFLLVFGMILVTLFRGLKEWNRNNQSPRLTVEARVVSRRTDFRRRDGSNGPRTTHTRYFATFEVPSGDRMELELQGHAYGMLVEGDQGRLSFQGTRYLGFERM